MDPFFVFLSQVYYALIISMISRPSKRLMLIAANQRWHIIHTSLEHSKENSSLEQSPEKKSRYRSEDQQCRTWVSVVGAHRIELFSFGMSWATRDYLV
jgi:hypothetical protein